MKKPMIEIVPLAEALGKLDDDAARKLRVDFAARVGPADIQANRPHRSARAWKRRARAQVQRHQNEAHHG